MSEVDRIISVAVIQMRCHEDRAVNADKAAALIHEAADRGAQVVCLPELFLDQYPCQTEEASRFELAEPVPGPTTVALGRLAGELEVALVASIFEKRAAGVFHNTVAVLDADGQFLGKYRKMHVPDDPLYYEKFYFTPGDLGYRSFRTKFAHVGPLVCWDQWFPEAARLTALQGAELIVYPTAIGWHPGERDKLGATQLESWITMQRSHAIANSCFVAVANRTGHEGPHDGGLDFWGHSFICDPAGRIVVEGSDSEEAVLIAELDLSQIDQQRVNWPFFRDRRIDSYEGLSERFAD